VVRGWLSQKLLARPYLKDKPGVVAHICGPNYSEGRERQEDDGPKLAQEKLARDPTRNTLKAESLSKHEAPSSNPSAPKQKNHLWTKSKHMGFSGGLRHGKVFYTDECGFYKCAVSPLEVNSAIQAVVHTAQQSKPVHMMGTLHPGIGPIPDRAPIHKKH
jgi:hypothetical protein